MAFQHIRSGDLANIHTTLYDGEVVVVPVKVRHIATYGNAQSPWADVTVTADRKGHRKGSVLTVHATDLVSRTPSKGISIPVWREEN